MRGWMRRPFSTWRVHRSTATKIAVELPAISPLGDEHPAKDVDHRHCAGAYAEGKAANPQVEDQEDDSQPSGAGTQALGDSPDDAGEHAVIRTSEHLWAVSNPAYPEGMKRKENHQHGHAWKSENITCVEFINPKSCLK